jgi:hypothetical protein
MCQHCTIHNMDYREIYNPLLKSYIKVCLKCSQDKFVESDKFYIDYSNEIDLNDEYIQILTHTKLNRNNNNL